MELQFEEWERKRTRRHLGCCLSYFVVHTNHLGSCKPYTTPSYTASSQVMKSVYCTCDCVFASVSIYLCVCMFVCLCMFVYVNMYVSVSMCVCFCACVFVCVCFLCLCVYLYMCLCLCVWHYCSIFHCVSKEIMTESAAFQHFSVT